MQKPSNSQKGFTILVAVVTAGILLIIAMTIGGIALKEQVLSIANKESQIAFYAADTALECAMYWDYSFEKGAFRNDVDGNAVLALINCNGAGQISPASLAVDSSGGCSATASYCYLFKLDGIPVGDPSVAGPKTCAVVRIEKETNVQPTKTHIYAYGYNTCDASLTRLERGIEAHY